MLKRFLTYTVLTVLILFSFPASAFAEEKENDRYIVRIDIRNAYISGICIMQNDGDYVMASIVNEFGVSAMTFRYDVRKRKVRILSVAGPLGRASIKRVLKSDLKVIMADFCREDFRIDDKYDYKNSRYDIIYTFKPMYYETAK